MDEEGFEVGCNIFLNISILDIVGVDRDFVVPEYHVWAVVDANDAGFGKNRASGGTSPVGGFVGVVGDGSKAITGGRRCRSGLYLH